MNPHDFDVHPSLADSYFFIFKYHLHKIPFYCGLDTDVSSLEDTRVASSEASHNVHR